MPEHKKREATVKQEVHFETVTKHPPPSSAEPGEMEIKDPEAKGLGLEEVKWLNSSSGGCLIDPGKADMTDSARAGLIDPAKENMEDPSAPIKSLAELEEDPTLFEKTVEKLEDTFEKLKKTTIGKNTRKDSNSDEENKKAPAEALDSGLQKTMDAADAIKNAAAEPSFLEKAAGMIGNTFHRVKRATVG